MAAVLANLTVWDLSRSALSGPILSALGRLQRLELSRQRLLSGTLPTELEKLDDVEEQRSHRVDPHSVLPPN
jgi:hypothetical protein